MARRAAYTRLEKLDRVQPAHVQGMGDVAFRGFNCLSAECTNWILVRDDELGDVFEIACGRCGFVHRSGEEVRFYRYRLHDLDRGEVLESGDFAVLVDDYLAEAERFKYCIVCNTVKPLDAFDNHASRRTGRQGECRLCKRVYNTIKNRTRTADQHREAAQKRRLYIDLGGGQRLDSAAVTARFDGRCFACGLDLSPLDRTGERHLDHTLPAVLLWPLTTENATLLCRTHNAEKAGKWPGEVYDDQQLRRLAALTGIDYAVLSGAPHFNPEALDRLAVPEVVDDLVTRYAPYRDELVRVRNRILEGAGLDIFAVSRIVSPVWVRLADAARRRGGAGPGRSAQGPEASSTASSPAGRGRPKK